MLEKRVIYAIPGMQEVIRRNVVYASDNGVPLTMDIYYPPAMNPNLQLPAVVYVLGYPSSVTLERFGIKLKDAGQYVSWAQLTAASGMIAITYETTQPEKDIHSLLAYARENAKALRVDGDRMGIWACSGNVPTALSVLIDAAKDLKCSVLYYGLMFDGDGSTAMTELARQYGAAYPCEKKSVDTLPQDVPLFVVRTGNDNPHLNRSIESFVREAVQRNLPLTFVNYAAGQHAFDVNNHSVSSRTIIKHTLAFLYEHLSS